MPDPFAIVHTGDQEPDGTVVLTRGVQTCIACPSQWDAWDAQGRYYYLRHRNGRGSVDRFASQDPDTWGTEPLGQLARFHAKELPYGGDDLQELAAFCELAGIELAPDFQLTTYQEYIARGADRG